MILGHHKSTIQTFRPHRQRGVIVPLTAFSLITVLLVATLVIDGSQAYPQRRTAQNAADNAALAGARALDKKKFGGTEDVYAAAKSVAEENGSQLINCWFITGTKTSSGEVERSDIDPTCDSGDPVPDDALGVQVRTTKDRILTFPGVNDTNEVKARAEAAASVQKLASAGSPFVVCGNPSTALIVPPGTSGFDLLWSTGPTSSPTFVYNADGSVDVDPAKVSALNSQNGNKGIPLEGSEVRVPRCGVSGGNFDGKGSDEAVSVPGWISFTSGGGHDASSAEQVLTANPCPDPFPPQGTQVLCDIILPIAIGSNPPANDLLRIVALGVFSVSGNGLGNPKYYGKYVANASQVSGGITTTGPVTAGTIRVIGLIE